MNARIPTASTEDNPPLEFPGGGVVLPIRSREEHMRTALGWLDLADETAADLDMVSPLTFAPDRHKRLIATLRSQLDHARRTIREAGR